VAERTGAADRRRRSDAIAALELFYVLHAGELAAAFPRDAFDRYVQRFLGEGEAPEAVEARARQAQESLSRHLAAPGGGHGGRALGGLQEWYAGMLRRIQAMQDLTDEARQNALSTLNEQMEERLRKLLSES
jgi:hypothetical protein